MDGMFGVGYLNDRPASREGRIPNADNVAAVNRETRLSATKIARFYYDQYERGLQARRRHALNWIKVSSIMAGVHYFRIVNGMYEALEKKKGQIRAHIPVMDWMYRWELGRFNSNEIGVFAKPVSANNAGAFYQAERAQAIMNTWLDEAGVPEFYDEANQHLLWYGTSGYFRYEDKSRQQVFLKSIAAPELFPIPFDARNYGETTGLMRATSISRDWLEMQDELYERLHGRKPDMPMAQASGTMSTTMSANYAGFASSAAKGSRFDGCLAIWVWMKPTEINPFGEHCFLLNDKLYRYVSGVDENGRLLALPGGKIPIEMVYYDKHPNSFWASGFLEKLIAMQRETNRQWSDVIQMAVSNKGFTAYNADAIAADQIQSAVDGLVSFRETGDMRQAPLMRIPPASIGREVGVVLEKAQQLAERAACYESGIPFGRQEGRTESGPATTLLDANAKAAVQPAFNRQYRAFKRTFPEVLDMLHYCWPQQKTIRIVGRQNIGREIMIQRDQIPWSKDVILEPRPLQANGKNAQMGILYQLRQLPSQDGKGFMLRDHEFRNGLVELNMAPPGMETENRPEQRILFRIEQLIGDGTNPLIPPSSILPNGQHSAPEQQYEDHRLAVQMLTDRILDPSFRMYSPTVQRALMDELNYHVQVLGGIHPDNFDMDVAEADARQAENFLEAAELDPYSAEGEMMVNGTFL